MKALFEHACPNCEGKISDERLLMGAPCEKCLPLNNKELRDLYSKMKPLEFKIKIMEFLKKERKLQKYYSLVEVERELAEFEALFKKGTGSRLWSAQREWARRVLKGVSFAITAPTGIGKTVFGMSMAIYLSTKGKKSYIILPTTVLVKQTLDRIKEFLEKARLQVRVAGYYAKLSKNEREEFKQMIETGNFDILITTSQYLALKFDEISRYKFDFIFVDDVDALLKLSKNIDRVLILLGFNNGVINLGLKLIKLKKKYLQARTSELDKIEYEIEETESNLNSLKEAVKPGILIVSTATGKARGDRVKLFRELLNFTIGSASEGYRNIQDLHISREENVKEQLLSLVKKFGTGGLIFVTFEEGIEFAEKIAEFLKEKGIRAEAFHAGRKSPKIIDQFSNGEIDILIGVASHYGLLVRGLDLPHRVRYAIFTGVPKFRFSLDISEETSPTRIYMLLSEIMEYLPEKEREKANNLLRKLRQYLIRLSPIQLQQIKNALTNKVKIDNTYLQNILNLYIRVINFVDSMLKRKDVLNKLRESPFIAIERRDEKLYMLMPDIRTYIQASGRTSRLFAGGVAKGVSILLVDNEKVFNGLVRQLRWRFEESEWKHLNDVDLNTILTEVDADRELILKIKQGKISVELKDPVKSALLIVESPSKAFTISTFFGKPARRRLHGLPVYEVVTGGLDLNVAASGGHVFDLVTDKGFHGVLTENGRFIPVYTTIKRCMACKEQFVEDTDKCPRCKSAQIKNSLNNVKALSEIASEVDMILIGTDPDTEGEKIGWDIATVLKPYAHQIKRVEFHEITKMAIRKALENPKEIDENRVSAQLVRRIEDRWIGFELSRRLWQKFRDYHLSAGRVQTPVLGWIIKRYREFLKSWKYVYWVKLSNQYIVELKDIKGDPHKIAEKLRNSEVKIISLEETLENLNPPPPFTTDEMLKEASRLLKFSAQETMNLAQTLFESGLCVTPDTIVMMKDGSIKKICEVKCGENILSTNDLHLKTSTVLKFWKIRYNGIVKEIILKNNYAIKATPDHALFVYRNGKFGWISAKYLEKGDHIAFIYNCSSINREEINLLELLTNLGITDVCIEFKESSKTFNKLREKIKLLNVSTKYKYLKNKVIPLEYLLKWNVNLKSIEKEVKAIYRQRTASKKIPLFRLNEGFWYFVGLVMSDGSVNDSKVAITKKDVDLTEKIVKEIFPFLKTWKTEFQIYFNNPIIAEVLRKLDIRGKLNGMIFSLPESWINSMLAGYMDTNCCISLLFDKSAGKHNLRILLSSKDKEGLEKIGFYLHSIGVLNRLHKDKRTGVYGLVISSKSLKRFKEKIGKFLRIKKEKFERCYEIYKKEHIAYEFNDDFLPFVDLVRKLRFKKGIKNKILKELGIDIWNWSDRASIPREKLKKVLDYSEDSEVKEILKELVNAAITWIKVKSINDKYYNGFVYDLTTTTSNFFANAMLNHNCTYHRTDSHRVSNVGIRIAKEYIAQEIGEEYFHARKWETKEEGAHECIRPTRPLNVERLRSLIEEGVIKTAETMTWQHYKLYQLIFNRFMASQMTPAKVKRLKAKIKFNEIAEANIEGIIEVIEPGFTIIQSIKTIPKLEEPLNVIDVKFKKIPTVSLYTQGDVVELMKKRGIGRPSTYATIIQTLLERGYVEEKNKMLKPTKLGIKIYEYLSKFYNNLVSEERTRELEKKMEEIEEGRVNYQYILKDLYEEIKTLK